MLKNFIYFLRKKHESKLQIFSVRRILKLVIEEKEFQHMYMNCNKESNISKIRKKKFKKYIFLSKKSRRHRRGFFVNPGK